ncbi:3-oxoacyl-[acyl-carrier protein] reductase [Nannocystis exedens]|uniref:3-oxoacyl-[acyl-carrier protein] reductase n=1 Tax=Nannocystis exedens TaxID=54 RepID=A0A1I1U9P3_9BACT|nr:SDR family oxidoreductase [Nannocystis exedens]PCC71539.1 3-ketoacyl-ACP reductase [Nannocystis exedens]SFD67581.1 3-oxoacyl-[acyl-carrier protein] reductase [Nannocystis exedens]
MHNADIAAPSAPTVKVALVTGSSRGIGAAIARRLAGDGFAVVVNYAGRVAAAEQVVRDIEAAGGRAIAVQADVADPAAVAALFDRAEAAFGGVDVLVNTAGVIQPGLVPIGDTDDALFDRLTDTNFKGTFNALRLAATRVRRGGRIVNLSTSVVGLALPGYAVYAATKAAVETMTNIFAKELRGREITVNAVAPGPTATDLFLDGKSPEQVAHLARMAPLERLGRPEDIADVVSFLAGPQGGWVNGQTLRVNGGIV